MIWVPAITANFFFWPGMRWTTGFENLGRIHTVSVPIVTFLLVDNVIMKNAQDNHLVRTGAVRV